MLVVPLVTSLGFSGRNASAAAGVSFELPAEGCPSGTFGSPALHASGRNLLVAVAERGCGYVSLRDGHTGRELRRFENPLGGTFPIDNGPSFGAALDVSGSRLLVGAPDERAVHALDARTGKLVRTYEGPRSRGDGFGTAVLGLGSRVVVGALYDGLEIDTVRSYGTVHVFDAKSGRLERSIRAAPEDGARAFGFRLARLAGDRVVVGTLNASEGGPGRIFVLEAGTGEVLLALSTPSITDDSNFHGAFATTRGRIIVGVPGGGGTTSGGAVYVHDAGSGAVLRTITSPGDPSEAFGAGLATRGSRLLVVAPYNGPDRRSQATIYLFDLRTGRLRGRLPLEATFGGGSFAPPVFLRRGFAYALSSGALEVVYRYGPPPPP